jgi:phosphorylase kinase gamma subunit
MLSSSFCEEFEILEQVGSGAFSKVYKTRERATQQMFAAKVITAVEERSADEVEIAGFVDHTNLLRTVRVFSESDTVVLVSELLQQGEVFELVRMGRGVAECDARNLVQQLLQGIAYMHCEGIAHCDIKLENLMLDQGTLKIIDFGFSRTVGSQRCLRSACGSPNYMAPEILLSSRSTQAGALPSRHTGYGKEVDVWAAGVVMYVLLFGQYPFHHERRSERHRRIVRAEYSIPADGTLSALGQTVLSKLLDPNPQTRPAAKDLLQLEWFATSSNLESKCLAARGQAASEGGLENAATSRTLAEQ